MKICFVTKEKFSAFCVRTGGVEADVVVFPIFEESVICYEKELRGETNFFEDVALLSKACKNVVICGCLTSMRGIVRASAVVAENGRIAGVSDALSSVDGKGGSGAFLRVYDTFAGRLGVCVADDLCFPELLRTLAVCGSDAIFCPFSRRFGVAENVLSRAAAFSYGTPVCLCTHDYAFVAGTDGETAFASPHSPSYFSVEKNAEFHLVEWRQRGLRRKPDPPF